MSYEIVFGDGALWELDWVPEEILGEIQHALERLARDPVRLGERAMFPDPWKGQKHTFQCRAEDQVYEFVAYFYYHENEREIRIIKVTGAPLIE